MQHGVFHGCMPQLPSLFSRAGQQYNKVVYVHDNHTCKTVCYITAGCSYLLNRQIAQAFKFKSLCKYPRYIYIKQHAEKDDEIKHVYISISTTSIFYIYLYFKYFIYPKQSILNLSFRTSKNSLRTLWFKNGPRSDGANSRIGQGLSEQNEEQ